MHILLIKHNTPKLRYYPYRIYFLRFPFVLSNLRFSSKTIQSIPIISASDNPPYTHASNINCSSEIIIQIYKFNFTFPNKKPPKFWLLSGGLRTACKVFIIYVFFLKIPTDCCSFRVFFAIFLRFATFFSLLVCAIFSNG